MSEHDPHLVLAAGSSASLFLILVGVVLVAGLLTAFWVGSRRTRRQPKPPQGPQPRSDSWQPPDTPTDPDRHD
ncbi:DUF6479 family protein [Streptomyces albipurpureus]|uniref:DUF6479 family protein n=1 Tax=Streptomyces albipurpureus TaxID=2897419 RepID=A0ABT0UNK9_9ACTN|nr:DUF6479 family protein [Streptomyces sp. CWNU-1]MCM2389574.1 DUF6479 family protein [Streptomyces sp. CWNU-1]